MKPKPQLDLIGPPKNNAHVERKRNNSSPLTPHAAVDLTLAKRQQNYDRQADAQKRIAAKLGDVERSIRERVPEQDRERFDRMLAFIAADQATATPEGH